MCEIPCLKILEKGRVREMGTEKREGVGICRISESLCVPKSLVSSHCSEGAVSCLLWMSVRLTGLCSELGRVLADRAADLSSHICHFPVKAEFCHADPASLDGSLDVCPTPRSCRRAGRAQEGHLLKRGPVLQPGQVLCFLSTKKCSKAQPV